MFVEPNNWYFVASLILLVISSISIFYALKWREKYNDETQWSKLRSSREKSMADRIHQLATRLAKYEYVEILYVDTGKSASDYLNKPEPLGDYVRPSEDSEDQDSLVRKMDTNPDIQKISDVIDEEVVSVEIDHDTEEITEEVEAEPVVEPIAQPKTLSLGVDDDVTHKEYLSKLKDVQVLIEGVQSHTESVYSNLQEQRVLTKNLSYNLTQTQDTLNQKSTKLESLTEKAMNLIAKRREIQKAEDDLEKELG